MMRVWYTAHGKNYVDGELTGEKAGYDTKGFRGRGASADFMKFWADEQTVYVTLAHLVEFGLDQDYQPEESPDANDLKRLVEAARTIVAREIVDDQSLEQDIYNLAKSVQPFLAIED